MGEVADPNPAGLPRPRADGRPVPWITETGAAGPEWRRIDILRMLVCQLEWRCQSCGLALPRSAYVIVNLEREVLSHAPLCRPCVAAALRWCPGLVGSDDIAVLPVTPDVVLADDEPLPDRWKNYGEETRAWTITSR